jgi:hypothetical protein
VHHHLFVLGDRSVLTVQQQGYHHQWSHLGQSWHKPLLVAHPPALLPADITSTLVQQALQHSASAVSQMSAWQKLLWAAMEGCRTVNLGTAIWEDVIKPMLNGETAAVLLGIVVLCAIPYVGEVVLVLLMGAAIYDLVTRVAGLFKQYYETAIQATSYEGLQRAAKYFSSAIIGGLLDLLGLIAGGTALTRIRLLRAQGRLTVGAWLEAMSEWGQQLARRLRSGGKMLERLQRKYDDVIAGRAKERPYPNAQNRRTGANTGNGQNIAKDGYRIEAEEVVANFRSISDVKINTEGIDRIKQHLSRPEFLEEGEMAANNKIMIERLEKIQRGEIKPTLEDKNFFAHELREQELMVRGMSYEKAHAQSCKEYGITAAQEINNPFYTKEAIDAWNRQILKNFGLK